MLFHFRGVLGPGKFPHSSLKAHFHFLHSWLSSRGKNNFPIRGFAAHGEILFTTPAKPFVEEMEMCLSWLMGKSIFPCSWLRHSQGKIQAPILLWNGITFLFSRWKLWTHRKFMTSGLLFGAKLMPQNVFKCQSYIKEQLTTFWDFNCALQWCSEQTEKT